MEQHGSDAKLTDLLAVLAENCPKARSISVHERCRAVYEKLIAWGMVLSPDQCRAARALLDIDRIASQCEKRR
jgi:hypothetical protein